MAAIAGSGAALLCRPGLAAGNGTTSRQGCAASAALRTSTATACAVPAAWDERNDGRTAGVPALAHISWGRAANSLLHAPAQGRHVSRRWGPLGARAMDASLGGGASREPPAVFGRIGVRDPYKRLGVSRDASTEEIQEARAYLVNLHGGHEGSREAIEDAYDRIIAAKFTQRKKTKMNLKTALQKRKDEAPSWVQDLFDRVEVPKRNTILQRLLLFALIGAWSVSAPAEGGPAFQVACALGAAIYFLNDRLKSVGRAAAIGLGALALGWIAGSLFVPAFLTGAISGGSSLELATALISYVFLFVATTFLK